jgi:hypothetical protein
MAEAAELLGDLVVHGDDLVEGVGDLAVETRQLAGELHGEVAAPDTLQGVQQLTAVEDGRGGDGRLRRRGSSTR